MQSVKKQEAPASGTAATVTSVQDVKAQERKKNIDFIVKNLIAGGTSQIRTSKTISKKLSFRLKEDLRQLTVNHV